MWHLCNNPAYSSHVPQNLKCNKIYILKKKRERTQVTNIKNEKGTNTTDHMDIKRITKECYEQLYACQFAHLDEMDQYLLKMQSVKTHTRRKNILN